MIRERTCGRHYAAAGFGDADEEMNYAMQFRIRAILFEYQERYILEPLLKRYTKEELRKLPESWKFAACGYYKKICGIFKNSKLGGRVLWKTNQNPVIYRNNNPDPSICRVGEDFYLVNSKF